MKTVNIQYNFLLSSTIPQWRKCAVN